MPTVETNRAKILKRLDDEGWILGRHGSEHDIYVNPSHPGVAAVVPRHRTLTPGVARQIAKVAGWL
jgi:predicted RNA binding protein YcfA (HicA-like mRNA interferase family)